MPEILIDMISFIFLKILCFIEKKRCQNFPNRYRAWTWYGQVLQHCANRTVGEFTLGVELWLAMENMNVSLKV